MKFNQHCIFDMHKLAPLSSTSRVIFPTCKSDHVTPCLKFFSGFLWHQGEIIPVSVIHRSHPASWSSAPLLPTHLQAAGNTCSLPVIIPHSASGPLHRRGGRFLNLRIKFHLLSLLKDGCILKEKDNILCALSACSQEALATCSLSTGFGVNRADSLPVLLLFSDKVERGNMEHFLRVT